MVKKEDLEKVLEELNLPVQLGIFSLSVVKVDLNPAFVSFLYTFSDSVKTLFP